MINRIKPHVDEELMEIEVNRSPDTQRGDIQSQLADVLYKRAQARLLIESNESNIESALVDALRVRVWALSAKFHFCVNNLLLLGHDVE